MERVNKHTRCGYYRGYREIQCPECDFRQPVFHFAWSAITCQNCRKMIDKYNWFIVPRWNRPKSDARYYTQFDTETD